MPRTYTIRGSFPFQEDDQASPLLPERVQLWNGSFKKNWIIEDVQIVVTDINQDERMLTDDMVHLVFATRQNGAVANFSTSDSIQGQTVRDNRQIWWQSMTADNLQNALDPDHLLVEDIWVNGWYTEKATGARYALNQDIGYIVTLRQETTSMERTILSLIKELAQDTPSTE